MFSIDEQRRKVDCRGRNVRKLCIGGARGAVEGLAGARGEVDDEGDRVEVA
jgi:hypothetical protein